MKRRTVIFGALSTLALTQALRAASDAGEEVFEITRSDQEWRAMLSDMEYHVMRKEGTERAFTSPLDKNYADGMYHCRGCDLPLYSSEHKYNSALAGPVFGRRRKMPLLRKRIANFSWSAPNATAAAADHIWDIYSMTAPNQRANAIASTASAWFLRPPKYLERKACADGDEGNEVIFCKLIIEFIEIGYKRILIGGRQCILP